MARSYEIKKVEVVEDPVFLRVVKLSVLDKNIDRFVRSVDRYTYRRTLDQSLSEFDSLINEIYIRIDLDTLRKIDNDPDAQKKFIQNNVHFLDCADLINIFFLKIVIKEKEKLNDQDIEYINSLLLYQLNDIYVVPILEFEGEIDKPTRVLMYNEFVEKLLEAKNTVNPNLKVGISVPSYYPRRKIDILFSLYGEENKEPTFVAVDFAYQRATDPSRMGILPTINSYFLKDGNYNYFIYGFNVKPYKKGERLPLSEEFMLIESGFNAVGTAYRNTDVRVVITPRSWDHLNKIFNEDDYRYHPLSEEDKRQHLEEWLQEFLKFDVNLNSVRSTVNRYVRQYNFYTLNEEFAHISKAIWNSELDELTNRLLGKEVTALASDVARRLSKVQKDMKDKKGDSSVTLDRFFN